MPSLLSRRKREVTAGEMLQDWRLLWYDQSGLFVRFFCLFVCLFVCLIVCLFVCCSRRSGIGESGGVKTKGGGGDTGVNIGESGRA